MAFISVRRRGEQDRPVHSNQSGERGTIARAPDYVASGFLRIEREESVPLPVRKRIRSYCEFIPTMPRGHAAQQAERCMDCGIPYCHTSCPVHNQIPDWNELVVCSDWKAAALDLHSTNNFPEITGRICPAPCEEACTLYLHDAPVTIKSIERSIADMAIAGGWVVPRLPKTKTGKVVAIAGSGPAGLAAAQQLARCGHRVVVLERSDKPGGLLRYGIPDFKLEKSLVDFRIRQLQSEGVQFYCGTDVGSDVSIRELAATYDAVLLACGADLPRALNVPGIVFDGVHFALPYLVQQNRRVAGQKNPGEQILAFGKNVIVVGGGDTASDCIGTAIRQDARTVTQIDIRPVPPIQEEKLLTWPFRPVKFRTSSSQAEGATRKFQTGTIEIIGSDGRVSGVRCVRVDEARNPIAGTAFELPAELVLIAIGFVGRGIESAAAKSRTPHGDAVALSKAHTATDLPGVFAAGDMRRGPSLVVWAIHEGRKAAEDISAYFKNG